MSSHEQFIEEVIKPLGVSPATLDAFSRVDRAEFIPEGIECDPYTDDVIVLNEDSIISLPSIVASTIELLDIQKTDTVFELGTASGYNAAVTSFLAKEVHTIDIDPRLATLARTSIEAAGIENIEVYTGDGLSGTPLEKRFNKMVLTVAVKSAPSALLDRLPEGGMLVAPVVRNFPDSMMTRYTKSEGELQVEEVFWCRFVPVMSESPGGYKKEELEKLDQEAKQARIREYIEEKLTERWAKFGISYHRAIYQIREEMTATLGLEEMIPEETALHLLALSSTAFSPSAREASYVERAENYLDLSF